mmetsp:Transcript_125573/g.355233  ORF Transcript_125573/g.355233 Transcript_125573/m.355233 type:complete len:180 (+) Transcript_125573:84-623(+)
MGNTCGPNTNDDGAKEEAKPEILEAKENGAEPNEPEEEGGRAPPNQQASADREKKEGNENPQSDSKEPVKLVFFEETRPGSGNGKMIAKVYYERPLGLTFSKTLPITVEKVVGEQNNSQNKAPNNNESNKESNNKESNASPPIQKGMLLAAVGEVTTSGKSHSDVMDLLLMVTAPLPQK